MMRGGKQFKLQLGFTLVEMAITLLIIGLLLGSVIKVRSLIRNAQISSDIEKLKDIKMAYFLYRDRFHKLPGEDQTKPGRFKTVLSTDLNPNDGLFYDLQQSGFITLATPEPAIGVAFKATWGGSSGDNYGLIAGENQVCITQVDTAVAPYVEARMDGGGHTTGDIEYTLNGSQLCMLMK